MCTCWHCACTCATSYSLPFTSPNVCLMLREADRLAPLVDTVQDDSSYTVGISARQMLMSLFSSVLQKLNSLDKLAKNAQNNQN